ncbi:general substrate transporter [Ilyonectria robusta]|uniref:general substrate transporter n=1 Tax=Ilyonectria robusta TaxID=1079257 RepID=UPI001E8D586D|nr:general substrate transporter [Ilyonectria robusta]KAH8714660.1 general substrate transporter [Ilyonectria robusta]
MGAQLLNSERDMTLWQACWAQWRMLCYASAAFLVGACFGYDGIINGASIAMPAFTLYFGDTTPDGQTYLPSVWTSLWTAMTGLAQALGGFGIGFVMDRVGRKWTVVGLAIFSVAGVAVQFAANSRGTLLAGKMLNGLAIGALFAVATAWASEISSARLRGIIQSSLILFQTCMQMLGLGIIRALIADMRPRAFKTAFAIQWPLAAVLVLVFPFVPESPVYLINKGRLEEAKKAITTIYGSTNSIDARFAHLVGMIRHENSGHEVAAGGYLDCFKGTDLRRTLSVIFIISGLNVCGAQLLTQNIYFLLIAGLPVEHTFDIGIGGFAFSICLVVASWTVLEKVGRRGLFLSGPLVSAVLLFVIGGLYYVSGIGAVWSIAVMMNLLIAWGVVSFLSAGWALTAELSTYRLRAKTQSIAVVSNAIFQWVFSFITPYIYNIDAANLGARTGFVYGGLATVYLAAAFWIVPETKGLSVAEVDWMFENRVPSRQFQTMKDQARAAAT